MSGVNGPQRSGTRWDVTSADRPDYFKRPSDEQFYSAVSQASHHSQTQTGLGAAEPLGRVSDYWKRAVWSLLAGTVVFFIAVAGVLGFTLTGHYEILILVAILSFAYMVLQLALTYYVYKDTRELREATFFIRQQQHPDAHLIGWRPRTLIWTLMFLFLLIIPFVEYGPITVYLYRRRVLTGVP